MDRGIAMSFQWLFAALIGAIILFFALYAAAQFVGIGNQQQTTAQAGALVTILNQYSLGTTSGLTSSFSSAAPLQVHFSCDPTGSFGRQEIQTATYRFNEWTEPGFLAADASLYVFAENPSEGKEFFVFSKPFTFPFYVAPVIYVASEEESYCFSRPPERIEEELSTLSFPPFQLNCTGQERYEVCFSGSCDIRVNEQLKTVTREGKTVSYATDALLYAAIIADPQEYTCQVGRLMKRTQSLANLYVEKSQTVAAKGCSSQVSNDLLLFATQAATLDQTADLVFLERSSEDLEDANHYARCRLW